MARPVILAAALSLATSATARAEPEKFSIGGDLGGTARYVDHLAVSDPTGFGLNLGLRTELNLLGHLKADARYMEGAMFGPAEDRYVDVSVSASTPPLLVFTLDLHELYGRFTSRPGDGLFTTHGGLGVRARLLGHTFKGGLGVSYVRADDGSTRGPEDALGAYLGLEHLFRSKPVDTSLRATWFVVPQGGDAQMGLLLDGDLTLKFKAGPVFLGPRLDVAYRNLGLDTSRADLFGQTQELSAHLGLAVHWGTGH